MWVWWKWSTLTLGAAGAQEMKQTTNWIVNGSNGFSVYTTALYHTTALYPEVD